MKHSKQLTTVTPLSKLLAMILFILLPFLGFYLGIQYRELIYSANKTVVLEQTQTPFQQAMGVVDQFENYQKLRNGNKVMRLFTPPISITDKSNYEFIMAQDYKSSEPRLFTTSGLGYYLISYKITNITQLDNLIKVEVNETRKIWSNVTGKYEDPSTDKRVFELVSKNGKYLVNKYYRAGYIDKYDAILY